jgi:hypothetical protein
VPPPTDTPEPPPPPTSTPEPVSEGVLDFVEPRWVHGWEPREGGVKVYVKITITGGAPPFTIRHDVPVHGETMDREYIIDFEWAGCGSITHSVTVESADGQSLKKDYWLAGSEHPWCTD